MKLIKRILLLIIFCPLLTYAQQATIKGALYKAGTSLRLTQALVTNLKTKNVMMSDELGIFSIKASPGDTLMFNKKGYTLYKQVIVNADDILVFLQPEKAIELDEVSIQGKTKQQELSEVMKDYRSKGTYFPGRNPPALLFLTSPLTGLYELFGRTPGNARRFARFSQAELKQNEITKRYNLDFVKRATGLNDEDAQKFMDYYTPSFEDIKGWSDYELLKRVKRQFEYFKKNKSRAPELPFKDSTSNSSGR